MERPAKKQKVFKEHGDDRMAKDGLFDQISVLCTAKEQEEGRDVSPDGKVDSFTFQDVLANCGIQLETDGRLALIKKALDKATRGGRAPLLDKKQVDQIFSEKTGSLLVKLALGLDPKGKKLRVPQWKQFTDQLQGVYVDVLKSVGKNGEVSKDAQGNEVHTADNASYIPELALVDDSQFAVSVCTVDGQRWSTGARLIKRKNLLTGAVLEEDKDIAPEKDDIETADGWYRLDEDVASAKFCIQSCCKPINYLIARDKRGKKKVHQHIGHEPSGALFNKMILKEYDGPPLEDQKEETTGGEGGGGGRMIPHNPMINAGAIMACSLIDPQNSMADRFKEVMRYWKNLQGDVSAGFQNSVYLSEKATADRNWCLAYMMKENGAFESTISDQTKMRETLEFYFQCCSIESTCSDMAMMAATLATGGRCPITNKKVFDPNNVRDCLSMMLFAGMYDYSGEWGYNVGVPAKSGVGGCVYAVIPNKMGIAVFSPPLDAHGNSNRSVEFFKALISRFNFHNFSTLSGVDSLADPCVDNAERKRTDITEVLFIAAEGDVAALSQVSKTSKAGLIFEADYDARTAAHLAACEGQDHILEYLMAEAAKSDTTTPEKVANFCDRWGNTAYDDAVNNKQQKCIDILKAAGGKPGPKNKPAQS